MGCPPGRSRTLSLCCDSISSPSHRRTFFLSRQQRVEVLQERFLGIDKARRQAAGLCAPDVVGPVIKEDALLRIQSVFFQKRMVNTGLRLSQMNLIGNNASVQVLHEIRILRMLAKERLRIIRQQVNPVPCCLQPVHPLPHIHSRHVHIFPMPDKARDVGNVLRKFLFKFPDQFLFCIIAEVKFMPEVPWVLEHLTADTVNALLRGSQIPQEIPPAVLDQNTAQVKNKIL